jgi:hypothetical protein
MLTKIIVVFIVGLELCTACDMDQTKQGCRIQNKACSCGFGCISEYRYDTMAECQNALRGRRRDICNPNPCQHGGSCIQISQRPKYKCRCEGTGYFGLKCSRACPTPGVDLNDAIFPYECIVIWCCNTTTGPVFSIHFFIFCRHL